MRQGNDAPALVTMVRPTSLASKTNVTVAAPFAAIWGDGSKPFSDGGASKTSVIGLFLESEIL